MRPGQAARHRYLFARSGLAALQCTGPCVLLRSLPRTAKVWPALYQYCLRRGCARRLERAPQMGVSEPASKAAVTEPKRTMHSKRFTPTGQDAYRSRGCFLQRPDEPCPCSIFIEEIGNSEKTSNAPLFFSVAVAKRQPSWLPRRPELPCVSSLTVSLFVKPRKGLR